jgi:hypothetical protein
VHSTILSPHRPAGTAVWGHSRIGAVLLLLPEDLLMGRNKGPPPAKGGPSHGLRITLRRNQQGTSVTVAATAVLLTCLW